MNDQAQTKIPFHQHGAFYDVQAALAFIGVAKDALQGIGALLQPVMHDEQLDTVHRSQVAAIFRFFGEALHEPVETAYDANDRLQLAAEEVAPVVALRPAPPATPASAAPEIHDQN